MKQLSILLTSGLAWFCSPSDRISKIISRYSRYRNNLIAGQPKFARIANGDEDHDPKEEWNRRPASFQSIVYDERLQASTELDFVPHQGKAGATMPRLLLDFGRARKTPFPIRECKGLGDGTDLVG